MPMLLQMPIFFALFDVLRNLPERTSGVLSFMGIIPNLALMPKQVYLAAAAAGGGPLAGVVAALPYLLLVLLFGVSIWLPQALMPGDKQQKMIGAYMAIVMLWFGWSSPAGVLLYWDVSSIWGVAQQQLTMWSMKRTDSGLAAVNVGSAQTSTITDVADKKPANKKSTGKKSSGKKSSKKG